MKRLLSFVVVAVAVVALFGYHRAQTTNTRDVRDVLNHAPQLMNKDIAVSGVAGKSFALLGMGGFELTDSTGATLLVVSGSGVPTAGTRVSIRGVLRQAYAADNVQKLILIQDSPVPATTGESTK